MSHTLVKILGFSIFIPALVALIRLKKINPIYYPFLICIWAGFINEAINYTLIDYYHMSNAVNTNIYCLVESLLYVWLFKRLGLFRSERFHLLLIIFLCATWSLENLVVNLKLFDGYFTIVYSLVIVLMSITMMNRAIIQQVNLLTNSTFFICSALIIYFTTFALTEMFWLYGLTAGESFRLNIYRIMTYINATVNLIFASAILWMHRKQEFIPQL
jgi:hypothetical protein